jgi:hypothetical protein
METRAYSICRRCTSVYPQGRRCPACEGDTAAALAVAAASAHAVEMRDVKIKPMRRSAAVVAGVVALSLIAGIGMLALALI